MEFDFYNIPPGSDGNGSGFSQEAIFAARHYRNVPDSPQHLRALGHSVEELLAGIAALLPRGSILARVRPVLTVPHLGIFSRLWLLTATTLQDVQQQSTGKPSRETLTVLNTFCFCGH